MSSAPVLLGLLLAGLGGCTAAGTPPVIVIHAPKADLRLEVARTESQRERGLMDRPTIAPHTGMIFVFDQDGPVEFWMKDTLASLDMIFIGADGTVRAVDARVPTVSPALPDSRIPLEPGTAKYVIELAAGEAALDGIAPGVKLDVSGVPSSLPSPN